MNKKIGISDWYFILSNYSVRSDQKDKLHEHIVSIIICNYLYYKQVEKADVMLLCVRFFSFPKSNYSISWLIKL